MKRRILKCFLLCIGFLLVLLWNSYLPLLESYSIGAFDLYEYVNLCLIDANYLGYYLISTLFLVLCYFMTYYILGKERALCIIREGKRLYYTRRYYQIVIISLCFGFLINGMSMLFLVLTGGGKVIFQPVYFILYVFQNVVIMSFYATIYMIYEIIAIKLGELLGMCLALCGSISFLMIMENTFSDRNVMRYLICFDSYLTPNTFGVKNIAGFTFSKLVAFVLVLLAIMIIMKTLYLESYERKDYLKNEKR